MSNGSSSGQNIGVIVFAIALVIVSAMVTMFFSGALDGSLGGDNKGYQNVTFTDASLTCKEAVKSQFGKKLRNLVIDNHSSRFDSKQFLYKIFLEADIQSGSSGPATLHYVNCFVKSSNGRVNKFESFEKVDDDGGKPHIDDGTNMFGMPKN